MSKKSTQDKKPDEAGGTLQGRAHRSTLSGPEADIVALQHNAGNQALTSLIEASREKGLPKWEAARPVVQDVVHSPGQPLDPVSRELMESRFDHDLSQVRVHTDEQAAESAQAVSAEAYTVGQDVVFGKGQYAPGTVAGQQLLAHELAHVVQQGAQPSLADQVWRHPIQAADASTSDLLKYPKERIRMPFVGPGMPNTTEYGFKRDHQYFWKEYSKKWGEQLSDNNQEWIKTGKRPLVDKTWIEFHPEHSRYIGQPIEHHHIGQMDMAVPLPERLHDAYTVFHARRQVVAQPGKKMKPLKSRPTAEATEREIARHTREGRLHLDPSETPKAPEIPLGSPLAALSPDELKSVSSREALELQQVDPTTGQVRGEFRQTKLELSPTPGIEPHPVKVPQSPKAEMSKVGGNIPELESTAATADAALPKGKAKPLGRIPSKVHRPTVPATEPIVEAHPTARLPSTPSASILEGKGKSALEGPPPRGTGLSAGVSPSTGLAIGVGAGLVGSLLTSWIHDSLRETIENSPLPEVREVKLWVEGGMKGRDILDLYGSNLLKVREEYYGRRLRFSWGVLEFWSTVEKSCLEDRLAMLKELEKAIWVDLDELRMAERNVRQALSLEPQITEVIQAAAALQEFFDIPLVKMGEFYLADMPIEDIQRVSNNLKTIKTVYQEHILDTLHFLDDDLGAQIHGDHKTLDMIQKALELPGPAVRR